MPAAYPLTSMGGKPRDVRSVFVAGGAAGALAAPAGSFNVGDEIISVSRFTTATFAPGTDLTAEFLTGTGNGTGKVTVADTINNTGGTSTAGQLLLVIYARQGLRG